MDESPKKWICIGLLLFFMVEITIGDDTSPSPLFLRPGHYMFTYSASSDSGFILPARARSRFALAGSLYITVPARGLPIRLQLQDLKHTVENAEHSTEKEDETIDSTYNALPKEAGFLEKPFLLQLQDSGVALSLRLPAGEPLWSINMKRSIAVALQMYRREFPGAFRAPEPCLHGSCIVEYSSSDGRLIRKSNNVPTLIPSPYHQLWVSIMPNVCTKDTKNPLIGNSEKWYVLDAKGMVKMDAYGSIEVHYHKHIFKSAVNFSLERQEITESAPPIELLEFPLEAGLGFQPPSSEDVTGERAPLPAAERIKLLLDFLQRAAGGLEQHGPRDTLLKEKLPMEIHRLMSTMTYASLKSAYEELTLGTSYRRETMLNIFLEALPQCTNPASTLLVRDLILKNVRGGEASLQLLRKLPFSVQGLGYDLLKEMEPLLKLGQEHAPAIRHSAILAFSTLVYRTFLTSALTEDTFEEYIQIYFSRFTASSDYADRLAWLSGLSNLQLQQVRTYLSPVIGGGLGHSVHERFLAVWATMPMAHLYPQENHDLYWPILQSAGESLEMKVAALTMLILVEPTPHRILSLYWFVSSHPSAHLQHYFYTTLNSLQHTTYDCYKHFGKLTSYLTNVVKNPGTRFWATGNYLVDASDVGRDMGVMSQTLTVADPNTGLPNVVYFTLVAHNAGLIVYDTSVYLKMQGVTSSFISKLRHVNGEAMKIERIIQILKDAQIAIRIPALVHIEVLFKYQGKIIMATHVNQTTFDKWTDGSIMKTVNNFLKVEGHVNQQSLLYPALLTSVLPSDLGMPVQTDTMLAILTSLRGNLTQKMNKNEIIRKNDVHFRTSSLALLSLHVYNPIADSRHTAEVAQVMDVYFPANFTVAFSLLTTSFRSSWLQPANVLGPGMTAYSGAKVVTRRGQGESQILSLKTPGEVLKMNIGGLSLTCEGPTKSPQLIWQLISSHNANIDAVPSSRILLLLLHTFALVTIPAEGACSLSLSHMTNLSESVRTDSEMQIIQSPDSTVYFTTGIVKRREEDNVTLYKVNTTSMLELGNKNIRFASKWTTVSKPGDPEWKSCLEFTSKQSGENVNVREVRTTLSTGPLEKEGTCPTNTRFGVLLSSISPNHTYYDVRFDAKNVPKTVSAIAKRVASVLEPLEEYSGLEREPVVQFALLGAGALTEAIEGNENSRSGRISAGEGAALQLGQLLAEGISLLGPNNEFKLLSKLGFMRECEVTRDSIESLKEETHPLSYTNCSLLLLGDCSKTPHFAFFLLPPTKSPYMSYRLYTVGNYADISYKSNKFAISINDEPIDVDIVYSYPPGENFYDFKITIGDEKVTVDSRLGGICVDITKRGASLQVPAMQMDKSCGRCMHHTQLYTVC